MSELRKRLVPAKNEPEDEILDPAQQAAIVAELVSEAEQAKRLLDNVARALLLLATLFTVFQYTSPRLCIASTSSLLLCAASPRLAPAFIPLPTLLLASTACCALSGYYLGSYVWIVPLVGVGAANALRWTSQSTLDEARALGRLRYEAPEA